jgi:hypothetical protein
MCLFLDDGTFISAGTNGIRRFNRDQTVMWEAPGRYHHQMNLSEDKKRILALTSETNLRGKIRERDDIIVIHDIESGKVLHKRLAREILTAGKVIPLEWMDNIFIRESKADIETSHFNSIYEIPENRAAHLAPYLKPGSVIINSVSLGIFILSSDLGQTLYHKVLSHSNGHHTHDVQVTASGEFIFFNNIVADNSVNYFYSAINKYNPLTDKITFQYNAEPKAMFFAAACGGVQEVSDDLLFFSHVVNGGFLYSRKQKKIIEATPGTNGNMLQLTSTQQIKLIDFRKFQENSR